MRLLAKPPRIRKPVRVAHGEKLKTIKKLKIVRPVSDAIKTSRVASLERALHEARERLDDMTRLAYLDGLTGIANRRAFDDELRRTGDRATRYGMAATVALFDIDRFKLINDVHGHKAGDAVIVAVARCLRAQIRTSDFVARIGGDEFAVILANIDPDDAVLRVEAMRRDVMRLDCGPDGSGLRISVSVGLSPIAGRRGLDPLHDADKAMYGQKRIAKPASGYL